MCNEEFVSPTVISYALLYFINLVESVFSLGFSIRRGSGHPSERGSRFFCQVIFCGLRRRSSSSSSSSGSSRNSSKIPSETTPDQKGKVSPTGTFSSYVRFFIKLLQINKGEPFCLLPGLRVLELPDTLNPKPPKP